MERPEVIKGVYLLVCKLCTDSNMRIGRLGTHHFKKGCYVYVGSAMNGLEQRIARHLRKNKRLHWHIDYFLRKAKVTDVIPLEGKSRSDECLTASRIAKFADDEPIKSFGSSDCRCRTHLFYFRKTGNFLLNWKEGTKVSPSTG